MFGFIRRLLSPVRNPSRRSAASERLKPMRFVEIVGESRYQDVLSEIAGGKTREGHSFDVRARVVPEDGNEFDPNAVRVEIGGRTVGYLSRHQAVRFRKRSAKPVVCMARVVGGWDDGRGDTGHFGVKLDLTL